MKTEKEKQIYFDGYRDALLEFGLWDDGVQTICRRPVKEILKKKLIDLGLREQPLIPNDGIQI